MNWKTEAIEKLRRYDAMRQAVKNLPEEIRRLEVVACSLRGATTDAAPVKGGGNRREEALINNLVHRQELQQNLEQAKRWVTMVNNALSTLTPEERLILHRLYICPEKKALDRLSGELGIECSSIYRRRDRALRKFILALYGVTDSSLGAAY